MKRVAKGSYGYIRDQKVKRTLVCVLMFAIPLVIFFTGLIMTGTRKNLFTLVAILGVLPAAKFAVSMIIMLQQKPMDEALYETIREHVKDMDVLYESTISSYERNMPIPCIVVSGLNVMCYTEDPKVDVSFAENHIKKILQGNGFRSNVKIFKDLKLYLRRLDELYPNHKEREAEVAFREDNRFPDATRDELVCQVLREISI